MVIACPHCQKKHNIAETKIPANARMARCRACGNTFPLELERKAPSEVRGVEETPSTQSGTSDGSKGSFYGSHPGAEKAKIRKIAISLSKGGVGKTTTAVNLAAGLAMVKKKVLLVDTDTQGQASYMLGVKPKGGLTELVTGELKPEEALLKARNGLWLLAGGRSLAGLKRLISRKDFGGELTIKEAIAPLEKHFEYIIFDSSPGWDVLTVNVLFCVDEVLVPVSLEVMTLQGLAEFLKSVASIQKHRKELELEIKYVLPTFFDKRINKSFTIMKKLESIYGERLCTPIRTNVRVSEAPAYGKTIYEFSPGATGSEDYRELIRKVTGDGKLFKLT